MGLDHIRELLSGRRSSRLVPVVSDLVFDLEVLVVSTVGLTGPNLRLGWTVLVIGASHNRSCTSVLCPGSLEICGLYVTAGTVPRRVSRLGGMKVEIAGSFVVSSFFSTPVSKSSTSISSSRSWKIQFDQACPLMLSKWIPSVALSSCSMSIRIIRPAFRLARFLIILFHLMTPLLCLFPVAVNVFELMGTVQTVSIAHFNFYQRVVNRHTIIDSHCASSSSEPLDTLPVPIRIIMLGILPG